VDSVRHGTRKLSGALKRYRTRKAHSQVGEIAIPSSPNAHTIYFENAIHARNRVVNLRTYSRRRSIEKSVNRAPRQTPTHRNNNASN
jgi:hypothetical protein